MPFLLFFFMFFSPFALSTICPPAEWQQSAKVKKINDGDTITLENDTRVRFIGINAPEVNYQNLKKSAPYALKAKELVERYIKVGDIVHLVFDKTKLDKYGRQLAYVYSKTGRNLAVLLLQAGYAKQWVIGLNDRFWICLQKAERSARIRRKGLWSDFSPLAVKGMTEKDKGYQTVSGEISELTKSKKGVLFLLDHKLRVLVSPFRLKNFTENNIFFREHDRLSITGKVVFKNDQPQLTLYHPVQILR